MYHKAYGIIETLAPLHVGASAGEETGNLNLIFRDQFTQTGIIPGSSIRGRFRADMRLKRQDWIEQDLTRLEIEVLDEFDIPELTYLQWLELKWLEAELEKQEIKVLVDSEQPTVKDHQRLKQKAKEAKIRFPAPINESHWYGYEAEAGQEDGGTTEALVKFEYASLLWLPVFCPGQPVVWITCPWLLKRYKQIADISAPLPAPYTAPRTLQGRQVQARGKILFFNLGFMEIEHEEDLTPWIPDGVTNLKPDSLVVVGDNDIAMLHDMALYRQSRVKLLDEMKKVDTDRGAFFNVEALPESSIMVFPIALKEKGWNPFGDLSQEMYFGGLESIGFGRCRVTLAGEYQ